MLKWPRIHAVIAILLILGYGMTTRSFPAAAEEANPIEPFVGSYAGRSMHPPEGEEARDLRVEIEPREDGFVINWITDIPQADGEVERHESLVEFRPTQRENIYIAAMRRDRFGNARPMEPVKGDPYFWATIHGDTLVVHGVHVTADGGYELQTYKRTLTREGMTVSFERIRDGEILREVRGNLVRHDN